MSLTTEQKQWLADDNEKIVLCDIEYHDGFTLNIAHFSNYPYVSPFGENFTFDYSNGDIATLNNIAYIDNLINIPTISSRIDSDVNVGNLEFLNSILGKDDSRIMHKGLLAPANSISWVLGSYVQCNSTISPVVSSLTTSTHFTK